MALGRPDRKTGGEYYKNMKLVQLLTYVTNNEKESRHEEFFDMLFLVINTAALIFGIVMFLRHDEPQWIPVLVIEYCWALDTLRHNRP